MNPTELCSESYSEMFERTHRNQGGAFIPFVVAGDPDFDTSLQIVKQMVEAGADALEIGLPFSDPVADGPTIQSADLRALNGGMNVKKAFEFVREVRKFTPIPIGLLVYYNLIYHLGLEEFYNQAKSCGVNGVLAADLPPEEADPALKMAKKYQIKQIFMVSQNTSNARLEKISKMAGGFIYVVAVMGVTGARRNLEVNTVDLINRVREHTTLPICVGFGISKPEHVSKVINAGGDGAIVASALIEFIEKNLGNNPIILDKIYRTCRELKKATIRGVEK